MTRTGYIYLLCMGIFFGVSCGNTEAKKEAEATSVAEPQEKKEKVKQNEKEPIILLQTDYGDIKVKLYNETPIHRDNFLKLVKEGTLDSTLFHRVIKGFMIQGGDPSSKNAAPKAELGNGGPGYTLDAEIRYDKFHKKGALAAARQGDNMNPKRESSGSQFYIVHGKKFTREELDQMVRGKVVEQLKKDNLSILRELQELGDQEKMQAFVKKLDKQRDSLAQSVEYAMTEEEIEAYTTIGGAPHLDDAYTVFGEVIEGLDIVDKIATQSTGRQDRPLKNIYLKKATNIQQ